MLPYFHFQHIYAPMFQKFRKLLKIIFLNSEQLFAHARKLIFFLLLTLTEALRHHEFFQAEVSSCLLFAHAGVLRNCPNQADAHGKQLQHGQRWRCSPLTAQLASKHSKTSPVFLVRLIEVFKLYYGFVLLITPDKQHPKTQKESNILKYKETLKWGEPTKAVFNLVLQSCLVQSNVPEQELNSKFLY